MNTVRPVRELTLIPCASPLVISSLCVSPNSALHRPFTLQLIPALPDLTGRYAPRALDKCIEVPSGFHTGVSLGASAIVACESGTFSLGLAVNCTRCPRGSYSASGSSSCTNCTQGRFASSSGMSECTACTPGRSQHLHGASKCELCERGTYQSISASTACIACAAGYSTRADIGATSCISCDAGRHSKGLAVNCTACTVGQWSSTTAISCQNCR